MNATKRPVYASGLTKAQAGRLSRADPYEYYLHFNRTHGVTQVEGRETIARMTGNDLADAIGAIPASQFESTEDAKIIFKAMDVLRKLHTLAPYEVRQEDARSFPHDEPCPRCGRRQWGLGPGTQDPMNPSDEEQSTCGACGTYFKEDQA